MNKERRRGIRITKHLSIQYQKTDEPERWDMTESRDFSEYGISITSAEKFEVGTVLRLRFMLPSDPGKWHEVNGKIISCQNDPTTKSDDSYLARIDLLNLDQGTKNLISQYVAWYSNKN